MQSLPLFTLLLATALFLGCEKQEANASALEAEAEAIAAAPEASPELMAQAKPPREKESSPPAESAKPKGSKKTVGTEKADAKSKDEKAMDRGKNLFNGKNLKGWKEVNFGGEGEVIVEDATLRLGAGESMTAVVYEGAEKLPTMDYEISLEANKLMGNDFFCGLTFPVRDKHATLIVGGWGGAVVGISNIDGMDASENETAQFMAFDEERWYKIRLRVAGERIAVWIDDKEMTDTDIHNRDVDMRLGEIELCVPLGIASYQTRAAFRNIRLKKLPSTEDEFSKP